MASRAAVDRKSVEREVKVVSAIRKKSFSVKIMKGSVTVSPPGSQSCSIDLVHNIC